MRKETLFKITLSAFFIAVAYVLPFLTGQIPQIGSMLCPMHIFHLAIPQFNSSLING